MQLDLFAVSDCLAQFGLSLGVRQVEQILGYVRLLSRWNKAINLTSIRDPREMIQWHFAESMYLTKFAVLQGSLLDVGSGAGFPGLALKIAVPELSVVLLEPVAKKRAFLKEVIRECELSSVSVSGARVEEFSESHSGQFAAATIRAVGSFDSVLGATAGCLSASGTIYLWLTKNEAQRLAGSEPDFGAFKWSDPIMVPLSRDREIWRGSLRSRPDHSAAEAG